MNWRSPFYRVVRGLALLALASLTSGCIASAVGADDEPNATFDLVTPAAIEGTSRASGVQVLVPEPSALATLASQRIVVRVGAREVQYLAGARYQDTLTRVTQFKLKRTLEASPAIGAAALPGEGLAIDYQVLTDIRAFEIRTVPVLVASTDRAATAAPRSAFVSLTVKLLDDRSGNVVASRVFERSAPVPAVTDDAAVGEAYLAALDAALDDALVDIRAFVASRV